MNNILIRQVQDYNTKSVIIKGWVSHYRSSGKVIFIELRDGTGIIQCVVFKDDVDSKSFESAKGLSLEASVTIYGVVRKDKRAKTGYEINVTNINIIQNSKEEYPISTKEHGVAFLLNHRHLWLRSSRQVAILKIRSTIINAIRNYLDNEGFMCFDTPIFTPSSCEDTTSLFETDYFNDKAYLTQSGQLYCEAGAMAFGKVYSFGPTFRAEKSKTRRHLTEFWMVEPEAAFYDLEMNISVAESFVAFIISQVIKENKQELEILERDISKLEKVQIPFPRITYDEAIDILLDNNHEIKWGEDFGGAEETILSEKYDKPLIIHRYPAECKPFYMKNDPERCELALNCDMLAPEGYGEIIGGGQREDDYDILYKKIKAHKLDLESFSWYLDLRKYGSVPHSGFGLGIERTVAWICGLKHVRETIPFPRLMDRVKP
ncbi:MAG: asparagine--tRNA ligase [Candidatus Latescibacteria bacterium]|nr:asparagine--tRNA ligase [Candidatus Latescibacterota bacterium]